jgi:hypothetical protein
MMQIKKKAQLAPGRDRQTNNKLAATRRRAAPHTPVATPVPRHDRAADVAAWCVAQVDKLFQRLSSSFFRISLWINMLVYLGMNQV